MAGHFDAWLERELQRQLNAVAPRSPRPAQARYQAAMPSRRYGLLRILPAVAAAGAVTATAVTGSPNPQVWGQQVKAQVESCKDLLHTGQHGIGDCVSDFASKHGQTQRNQHAQSTSKP